MLLQVETKFNRTFHSRISSPNTLKTASQTYNAQRKQSPAWLIYSLLADRVESRDSRHCGDDGSKDDTTSNNAVEQVFQRWGNSCLSDQWMGHSCTNTDHNTSNECFLVNSSLLLGTAEVMCVEGGRAMRTGMFGCRW